MVPAGDMGRQSEAGEALSPGKAQAAGSSLMPPVEAWTPEMGWFCRPLRAFLFLMSTQFALAHLDHRHRMPPQRPRWWMPQTFLSGRPVTFLSVICVDRCHPRATGSRGNDWDDNATALNTGPGHACFRSTDGWSGNTIVDQREAHGTGTLRRHLGWFASFVVAAGFDQDNCIGTDALSGSVYGVTRHGGYNWALGEEEDSSVGEPVLHGMGRRRREKHGTKGKSQHDELQYGFGARHHRSGSFDPTL
jgi:hypothetical protein